ncbi:MAG: glycosyl hydrolase family 18, partial [Parabacteroides sp.]|nr:glycosyl hydrolase family 18 [Parabacteroides sp.]
MKRFILLGMLACFCMFLRAGEPDLPKPSNPYVVAYVTSGSKIIPDVRYITHLNYAFGHVNDRFDGVKIDNESRL